MPRGELTYVRLALPALGRRRLLDAVRLQLTQYMPAGHFAFACRSQADGFVAVWAWALAANGQSHSPAWPEPAFDQPLHQGLRLLRRGVGYEGQYWLAGELLHSRWFATPPGDDEWQRFARGCGAEGADHPLPAAVAAPVAANAMQGWLLGDSLPAVDPWRGWRWQAAVLALGAALAAAIGMHLQARQQLQVDLQRLEQLRKGREAALVARASYEQTAGELEALRALVPRMSQLELMDRVSASGVFEPVAVTPVPSTTATPALAPLPGRPPAALTLPGGQPAAPPQVVRAQLVDWDYRAGQLKIALELPERDLTLLDITRRIERVPGLGALRVGQDSTGNVLSLTASVADIAPLVADSAPPAGAVR